MKDKRLYIWLAVVLIIMIISSTIILVDRRDPNICYYPIEKTVPLEIEAVIDKLPDGGVINVSLIATANSKIYIYDSSRKTVFRFTGEGKYDGILYEGNEESLPTTAMGFDVDDNENFVISTIPTIVIGYDSKINIFQNRYPIRKIILHDNKIFALSPSSGKNIISIYDLDLKYQKSFGAPACKGFDKDHSAQLLVDMKKRGDDIILSSHFLPMYSINHTTSLSSSHFQIPGDDFKRFLPEQKKALSDYASRKTQQIEVFMLGACSFNDNIMFCLTGKTHFLIFEMVKNETARVFSVDKYYKDTSGKSTDYGVVGINTLKTTHGNKLIVTTYSDNVPILIISLDGKKEEL